MAEVPALVVDATIAAKWHLKDEEFVREADLVKQDHLDGKVQLVALPARGREDEESDWREVSARALD